MSRTPGILKFVRTSSFKFCVQEFQTSSFMAMDLWIYGSMDLWPGARPLDHKGGQTFSQPEKLPSWRNFRLPYKFIRADVMKKFIVSHYPIKRIGSYLLVLGVLRQNLLDPGSHCGRGRLILIIPILQSASLPLRRHLFCYRSKYQECSVGGGWKTACEYGWRPQLHTSIWANFLKQYGVPWSRRNQWANTACYSESFGLLLLWARG
jgi:hypothetical protein